jgi:hypothetical protein
MSPYSGFVKKFEDGGDMFLQKVDIYQTRRCYTAKDKSSLMLINLSEMLLCNDINDKLTLRCGEVSALVNFVRLNYFSGYYVLA